MDWGRDGHRFRPVIRSQVQNPSYLPLAVSLVHDVYGLGVARVRVRVEQFRGAKREHGGHLAVLALRCTRID